MIEIKRNPNCDTRTCTKIPSLEEFSKFNDIHIKDVSNIMNYLSEEIKKAGLKHDFTKKEKEKEQYETFISAVKDHTNFAESKWYKYHVETERHHLFTRCPDDVNLIDVLEMISDVSSASLSRSNEMLKELAIPSEILQKAVQNTIKLINDQLVLVDED